MSKKVSTNSPKLYIGMDVHKKSWKNHFCTDISSGATHTMPPDPELLYQYVSKYYLEHKVVVAYEAGCCGFTAARAFEEYGWDCYVVNPADIPRPAKQSITKTDRIDARNIAMQLRAGNLNKITIPEIDRECLRSLTRWRSNIVKDMRKIKSRIKSMLLLYAIKIPDELDNPNWSKAFESWLRSRRWNFSTIQIAYKSMLDHYFYLDKKLRSITNQIRAHCRQYLKTDYNLLRSVPGIAGLTAAYILAEIGDLRRFSAFKDFASYVGIVPGLYSSGETHRAQGVTPRANRTIRSLIVESSWVAIRKDPVLQAYYRSHAGRDSKAVIFKVARKLLSRVHAVIKTGIAYEIGVIK